MSIRSSRDLRPTSLAAARAISVSKRRAWERRLVWFHIDDLNGLYDALVMRLSDDAIELARHARERIEASRSAARWNPAVFEREAWSYVSRGCEQPEDVFGAALLLCALGVPLARVRARSMAADTPAFLLVERLGFTRA